MKANELMIGDWVSHRGIPKQVVYIYCRPMPNGEYPANEIGFTHNEDEWIDADHAEPVPLTEEILKANDWELDGEYWIHKGVGFEIIDNFMYELQIKFNFVHELQHALRLCGLNDLADNFKLKADGKS